MIHELMNFASKVMMDTGVGQFKLELPREAFDYLVQEVTEGSRFATGLSLAALDGGEFVINTPGGSVECRRVGK